MAGAPLLQVRQLKRAVQDRVIWADISFELRSPGERLFVKGPSGVGKSLLLRALAGLDPVEVSPHHSATPATLLSYSIHCILTWHH